MVLTDGPDSPIRGKVSARAYPVEERIGLVWVWMGDGPPSVSVEADVPRELLELPIAAGGRITVRQGNWRLAAENGFDEGHAKYLHRYALWTIGRIFPVWTKVRTVPIEDGWITNVAEEVRFQADFPGYGKWPRSTPWWKRRPKKVTRVSLALPGRLRVEWPRFSHYEWYVPVDADHHRYIQMAVKFPKNWLDALQFKLQYRTYMRWLFHGLFNDQDLWMVRSMDSPLERFYRPDVSVIGWRNMCEHPRGAEAPLSEVRVDAVEEIERTKAGVTE